MEKEKVFNFVNKVEYLLSLLEGTVISADPYKVDKIRKVLSQIESETFSLKPSVLEEYSLKTKKSYLEMRAAKRLYEECVINGNKEEVKYYKKIYQEKATYYIRNKKYRDKLKIALTEER